MSRKCLNYLHQIYHKNHPPRYYHKKSKTNKKKLSKNNQKKTLKHFFTDEKGTPQKSTKDRIEIFFKSFSN